MKANRQRPQLKRNKFRKAFRLTSNQKTTDRPESSWVEFSRGFRGGQLEEKQDGRDKRISGPAQRIDRSGDRGPGEAARGEMGRKRSGSGRDGGTGWWRGWRRDSARR